MLYASNESKRINDSNSLQDKVTTTNGWSSMGPKIKFVVSLKSIKPEEGDCKQHMYLVE
jgi:hypothetical protein